MWKTYINFAVHLTVENVITFSKSLLRSHYLKKIYIKGRKTEKGNKESKTFQSF